MIVVAVVVSARSLPLKHTLEWQTRSHWYRLLLHSAQHRHRSYTIVIVIVITPISRSSIKNAAHAARSVPSNACGVRIWSTTEACQSLGLVAAVFDNTLHRRPHLDLDLLMGLSRNIKSAKYTFYNKKLCILGATKVTRLVYSYKVDYFCIKIAHTRWQKESKKIIPEHYNVHEWISST